MIPTASIFNQQPDLDTMGGRLSRAREAACFSIRDLAWRLGVSAATVKGWESDRSQPEAQRLTTIAGLLSVSISWILHGVGTSPDEPDSIELAGTVSAQLDRLKLLHMETGHLITKLEGDLGRLREASPP